MPDSLGRGSARHKRYGCGCSGSASGRTDRRQGTQQLGDRRAAIVTARGAWNGSSQLGCASASARRAPTSTAGPCAALSGREVRDGPVVPRRGSGAFSPGWLPPARPGPVVQLGRDARQPHANVRHPAAAQVPTVQQLVLDRLPGHAGRPLAVMGGGTRLRRVLLRQAPQLNPVDRAARRTRLVVVAVAPYVNG
jgi:hypothetical protein